MVYVAFRNIGVYGPEDRSCLKGTPVHPVKARANERQNAALVILLLARGPARQTSTALFCTRWLLNICQPLQSP